MPINSILSMGGYGAYVWTAYGITLLVFGMLFFVSVRENKAINKIIQQQRDRQTS